MRRGRGRSNAIVGHATQLERVGPFLSLNRPKQLNSFTQLLLIELKDALQFLASHKETVFTVLTGTGR